MKPALITLVFIMSGIHLAAAAPGQRILGAKVYHPVRDAKELVQTAKSLGLNTLFVGDELATSEVLRDQCRKMGLKYFLIIRTFNDPEAARSDPTLVSIDREGRPARRGDDVMVCPSRADFRREKLQRIRTAIEHMKPDGVTLDYFRFFIYWEGVDPKTGPVDFPAFCFDRSCLEDFLRSTPPKSPHAQVSDRLEANRALSEEIWKERRDAWYAWRVGRIEEDAREMTKSIREAFPHLPIVLHAVPWTHDEYREARERIVGQDLRRLAPFFDYVSPMAYSALTRRGPGWVGRLDHDLLAEVPASKLLPSVEVGPDGPQFPPMPPEHYKSDLRAALETRAGVVLYHLELLLDDPGRQAITRRLISRSR